MPQCQFPVFCCFCVSEKLHMKYSQNWTKQKLNLLLFAEASKSPKRRRRGAMGWPQHRVVRPAPGPRPLWVSDCYRWRGDDGVNDRAVGKPQEEGMMNIAVSFYLSKKPRLNQTSRKKPILLKVMLASLVTSNKGAIYDTC
jgi:hypothetical protein